MAVGIAPVDMIPAMNAVGNPDVVEPVPMYPKFGRVNAPADKDAEVATNDPADNPPLAIMLYAPEVAILPTNGASINVKLDVAEATELTAEVALLTNHETLFVAFWVIAVSAVIADDELAVNADTAANPPEERAPAELNACAP